MARLIRGVLFDKDGTLIDFQKTWGPMLRQVADILAEGDTALADGILRAGGHDPRTMRTAPGSLLAAGSTAEIAEVWAKELGLTDVEALTARMDALFTKLGPEGAVPVPGLRDALDALVEKGLILGIATSDSEAAARRTAGVLGLADHFVFICGYDSGHGVKPTAGMVLGFCKATGLPPAEVAVVGDNLHDLEMARAADAGLVVGVLTGTGSRDVLAPHADVVLPGVAQLPTLINPASGR